MGVFWMKVALCLACVSVIAVIKADSTAFCYSFEGGLDPSWINIGPVYWKGSNPIPPDVSTIPDFSYSSDYMWLQDQLAVSAIDGTIDAPNALQLKAGDKISANIYSYVATDNIGTTILSFYEEGEYRDILKISSLNTWTDLSVTCVEVPGDDTQVTCCGTYPCVGKFRVTGTVATATDLLAIDRIAVNNGCDPSPTWCCSFDADECDWSPHYVSAGWIWSHDSPNPTLEALLTPGDEYIYIEDTSANASSAVLQNVPASATFTLNYYFSATTYDAYNRVEVSFTDTSVTPNQTTYLEFYLNPTYGAFKSVDLPAPTDLCHGATICNGVFLLTVYNTPGDQLLVALDNFSVDNTVC